MVIDLKPPASYTAKSIGVNNWLAAYALLWELHAVRGGGVQVVTSLVCLHVPQSIIKVVNVLNTNSLVDLFSVHKIEDNVNIRHRKRNQPREL